MNEYINLWPVFVAAAIFLGLLYMVSQWCIADAIRRGKSPLWVSIAAILFFPWGLIAWLIFRPDILEPRERLRILSDSQKL